MKELKEFISDALHNKHKKAILSLGLWFLFFVIVFLMIGGRNAVPKKINYASYSNSNTLKDSPIENYKNMENFEFDYIIEIAENNLTDTYNIHGTYYNNKYYFELLNNKYLIDNNTIYIVDDLNKKLKKVDKTNSKSLFSRFDLRVLMKDNIYTFISSSSEKNSTKYNDGTRIINYLYQNYENKTIDLTVSIKEKMITSIIMDFKNYFSDKYQVLKVSLNYQNINNIMEYNNIYDGYQLVGEGE